MKNMQISKKLIVSFLIVIVLTIIVGAAGIFGMVNINSNVVELYENQMIPVVDLSYAREYFQRLRSEQRNIIINAGDPDAIDSILVAKNHQRNQFNMHMENFRPTIASDEALALYNEAMREMSDYIDVMADMAAIAKNVDVDVADVREVATRAPIHARPLENAISAIISIAESEANQEFVDSNTLFQTLLTVIIIMLGVAIAVALLLAFFVSGLISKPLGLLTEFMSVMSTQGDIVATSEEQVILDKHKERKDEVGNLFNSFQLLVDWLNELKEDLYEIAAGNFTVEVKSRSDKDVLTQSVAKVTEDLSLMFNEINLASMQVSSGSQQIANGAQMLAQGSTEQAATVEQLSASTADIATQTKANEEMASRSSELGEVIRGNAEKGSRQMDEMVHAVDEINQASQSISKVIKVIDDIAFQTNILALNAAVEAARAGQHGKGFAVVADEVRTLAAKSAEAAKDTGGLISNSMEKAKHGTRIAEETSESLNEIVSGINEISGIIKEIAKSSESQTVGISQINNGIDQVAMVIQQNSATAEESAAASEELSGQSITLEGLIGRFKLKSGTSLDSGKSLYALPTAK